MSRGEFSSQFELGALEAPLAEGSLLLTPNQRLARVIKAAWDRRQAGKGLSAWKPATVQSLDNWLAEAWRSAVARGELPGRLRLSSLQAREIWLRVIARDSESNSHYSLLQTGSAADLAAAARDSLLHARLDYRTAAMRSEFQLDTDCGTFLRWLDAFDDELARAGRVTAADCLSALTELSAACTGAGVILVDLEAPTPLERACLEVLAATVSSHSTASGQAETRYLSFPDRPAELAAVADWAASAQRERPAERLGIILRDMQGDRARLEYELRRAFDCLGDNYTALPVNFSTALRLDQVPVVRDALHMLGCCQREIPLASLCSLFRSRFCLPEFALDPSMPVLLGKLFADGREQVELSRLRFQLAGLAAAEGPDAAPLARLAQTLTSLRSRRLHALRQSPSAWADTFSGVLELWQWPGSGALDSLEYQQVESWYRLLDVYSGMDGISGEIDLDEALALLARCCRAQSSQPKTPDSPVQVLGPLEAAGLQFEQIWICGLEGSQWPEPPRPNPFVPQRLQRQHRMPHASSEQQWEYAESLWQQYLGGCRLLQASYARQLDNAPQLPSPFLQGEVIESDARRAALPLPWLKAVETASLEFFEDDMAPPVPANEQALPGGSGVLRDQAACPFRAYASRRLGVEALGEPRAGLSPQDRGNLLHAALQALWSALGGSRELAMLDRQQREQHIESAVRAAIDAVPESLRILVGMHCLQLESRRLETLLDEWLALETGRGEFTVEANEAPCQFTLAGKQLTLRVDRVDRLEDGSRIVVDYKSSKCRVMDWSGERPKEPQLPLYGIATGAGAIAFAQVRARECKFLGVGELGGLPGISDDLPKALGSEDPELDWEGVKSRWSDSLEQLMQEFIAGEARVDPQTSACDFCGLQSLCRVEASAHPGSALEESMEGEAGE